METALVSCSRFGTPFHANVSIAIKLLNGIIPQHHASGTLLIPSAKRELNICLVQFLNVSLVKSSVERGITSIVDLGPSFVDVIFHHG